MCCRPCQVLRAAEERRGAARGAGLPCCALAGEGCCEETGERSPAPSAGSVQALLSGLSFRHFKEKKKATCSARWYNV